MTVTVAAVAANFSRDLEENYTLIERIVAEARDAGVQLLMGFNHRHRALVRIARERVPRPRFINASFVDLHSLSFVDRNGDDAVPGTAAAGVYAYLSNDDATAQDVEAWVVCAR